MKYLVIGAGGTGGCIGAYMAEAGKDVTLIARGKHLEAITKNGLKMETTKRGNYVVSPIKACDMNSYDENPDVIFVCVKGYSLEETIPFIKRVANNDTIIIPILNIYGTGSKLQEKLPDNLVTDGCIYVAGEIKEPGCIWMNGDILKIVYGVRDISEYDDRLEAIKNDLEQSGVEAILSDNIKKDALLKFSYISCAAACGQYYGVSAGEMQVEGEIRNTFCELIREIQLLSDAMNIKISEDLVERNLKILDSLAPTASTSMQRDITNGKNSEIDGLIYEVVRLGQQYKVELPVYIKISNELRNRGL